MTAAQQGIQQALNAGNQLQTSSAGQQGSAAGLQAGTSGGGSATPDVGASA